MSSFDLLIIGSGPGGYVAAVRATQLGLKTAIVEKEPTLGGVCLNWGCIPTKALLTSSGLLKKLGAPGDFGLTGELTGDFAAVMTRSRQVVEKLTKGVAFLMKNHGVTVLSGEGKLLAPGLVAVNKGGEVTQHQARFVLLATGAKPRELPGVGLDGEAIIGSRELLALKTIPASLLVVGGGAIGVEFADFFQTMGVQVSVVEYLPQLLPQADEDVAKALAASFKKRGVEVLTGVSVAKATRQKSGLVETELVDQQGNHLSRSAEKVLLAVGVTPNTQNLWADGLNVATDPKGFVRVNEQFETTVPGVYAIGDLVGAPLLAHAASQEARAAVGHMAGKPLPFPDPDNCPGCVYTHPEVASVGLTEAQLKNQGLKPGEDYKVGKCPFAANGRALAGGESEGFVKVLLDARYGSLLGAHLIGPGVSELIAPLVMMRTLELTVDDLLACTFPHPTLSEAVYHALADAVGLRTD